MTDITLPTETQVRAVDTDTFTWDDLITIPRSTT